MLGLGLVPSGLVVGSWPEDMICWPGAAAAAFSRYCLMYSASLGTTFTVRARVRARARARARVRGEGDHQVTRARG